MLIVPVILAGGTGSRLWPLSRSMHPKQLLPLLGGRTMLQEAALRTRNLQKTQNNPLLNHPLIVVCNQDHTFLVNKQLQEIDMPPSLLIAEPHGKNTAPAAAIAAMTASQHYGEDAILLILPADHFIKDLDAFTATVRRGAALAQSGKLVTFGVTPTQPETGYGYIKVSQEALDIAGDIAGFAVEQFVEKPDIAHAIQYVNSSHYYWNSGMFMWSAKHFLEALQQHAPDIFAACEKTLQTSTQPNPQTLRLDAEAFKACPSNSIDYAIMEKTQHAALIPLKATWSDLGSFAALWEMHDADEHGNVTHGDVIAQSVEQSYLHAESRMLAVVGVKDHVIVETADAVLVAHRSHSQEVKEIVAQLKQRERVETVVHKKVYRPWGYYEVLNEGKNYQVKRLTLLPGASISLQMHFHRSEHWVVVNGTAKVRCNDDILELKPNESTYIPCQAKHKLSNTGHENLEVIEVQSGSYLGEDDIVRFD